MVKAKGGSRGVVFPTGKNENIVSIIIVTLNAEAYLHECLQSIDAQQFQQLEVIVFDGASTDKTVDILKANDHLITYWQSEPDKGIYEAMNNALKKATGDWLLFLGVDDTLLPSFSDMANRLKDKRTIYFGDSITDKNEILDGHFSAYRLTKMNICHQSVFYPADVFKKYTYQPLYRVYADYALNIQCWGDRSFGKKYIPILITRYHSGGFSSVAGDAMFEKAKADLIKKYMPLYVYLRYLLKQHKERRKKRKP